LIPINENKTLKVGVLGLGMMGSALATNLISKGYEVHAFNRTRNKARAIEEKGAIIHPSPRELASSVDILITSLTDERVVEELAFGNDGFLTGLSKDSVWIEMSTIDPDASVALADQARQLGLKKLDAPIVGNPEMEEKGKVIILVGGARELFQKYESFLSDLGSPVLYLGPAGSGSKMKLVINLYLGLIAESFSEAFVLSEKLGFEPEIFVKVVNNTAHRNFFSEIKGPKIAAGDFQTSFSMDNLLKDLRLAKEQADAVNAVLPASDIVTEEFAKAVALGEGKKDFSAIAREIEHLNGLIKDTGSGSLGAERPKQIEIASSGT
jgi:3-hydroxyisobutyrate dehydrogenase-like beta-hydroxyacid dehydrogenase